METTRQEDMPICRRWVVIKSWTFYLLHIRTPVKHLMYSLNQHKSMRAQFPRSACFLHLHLGLHGKFPAYNSTKSHQLRHTPYVGSARSMYASRCQAFGARQVNPRLPRIRPTLGMFINFCTPVFVMRSFLATLAVVAQPRAP